MKVILELICKNKLRQNNLIKTFGTTDFIT